MSVLNPVEMIVAKRDGRPLSDVEIRRLIADYTAGLIPDYQMSALLMAAFLQGMNEDETLSLTRAMLDSGRTADLASVPGIKVDKHSTGGVGDKISIVLAPLVAAAEVPVPMISGRGLGHSGGTLDKLESIPGFRTDLTLEECRRQLLDVGVVMVGQTEEVAPADRKIYALRDVTGTIEFVPFIVASIMSKKIASGLDSLVLDVKVGRGAFMKDEPSARLLAESLVKTGEQFGKRTVALLTDMNDPLGYAVGNWPEMKEAIRCLKGEAVPEVVELTLSLAAEMLVLGGKATSLDAGKALARVTLDSGRAFETFVRMVSAQGGDTSVIEHPDTRPDLPAPIDVIADDSMIGVVTAIDALRVGQIATALGAGRRTKEDSVDPAAGITLLRKPGSSVQPGDPIARLHTRTQDTATDYAAALRSAYAVDDDPPTPRPVIRDRFSERGWSSLLS